MQARPPCPSLSPRACSNSCPLSWWHHSIISSSVTAFSSCHQSFPAWGSFPVNQLFTSDGQVLELQFQHQLRVDFTYCWLVWSPCCSRNSRVFSHMTCKKASILWCLAFFMVQLSHLNMITGKTVPLTIWTFCQQSDICFLIYYRVLSSLGVAF